MSRELVNVSDELEELLVILGRAQATIPPHLRMVGPTAFFQCRVEAVKIRLENLLEAIGDDRATLTVEGEEEEEDPVENQENASENGQKRERDGGSAASDVPFGTGPPLGAPPSASRSGMGIDESY